jgi:chromosome segregation ATPase
MSWTVDGRMYHDYGDYQAARQRKAEREATSNAAQARAEMARYRKRLRASEAELTQAQGDIARQRNINEQMHQDLRGMQRQQRQLAEAQARFERESNARLKEIRADLADMDEQLAEVEKAHQAHVEATRRAFEEANQALQAGLAEAEQRRRQTEQRLTAAVQEVDRKVEHDRRQRLQRQRDDLDQAGEQIKMVEEVLDRVGGALKRLNLEEDEHSARMTLQSAQGFLRQEKASPALTKAESAFVEARSLVYKSQKRSAELSAAASAVADRIADIHELVKFEKLDTYFKGEKSELLRHLSQFADRLPRHYQQYSRHEDDLRDDERILGKLEEEARGMVAMCAMLEDQIAERRKRVTAIVRKIADNYGGTADINPALSDPNDVKSALIVNCVFDGGEKVRIEAGIDGEVHIDGAGHRTQDACNRRSAELVQSLTGEIGLTDHRTLPNNPSELPHRATQHADRSWQEIRSRLSDIGKQI